MKKVISVSILSAAVGLFAGAAQAQQAEAALKKHGCLKCHSVSADKDGPSYKSVAAKYKGQKDAAAKLEGELKKGSMKVDGKDVKHAAFKGSDADLKSVVTYILSR